MINSVWAFAPSYGRVLRLAKKSSTPHAMVSHLCSAKGETDDDTLCKILFRFGYGCVSLPLSAPAVRARHHAEQPVRNGPEHRERSPHDHSYRLPEKRRRGRWILHYRQRRHHVGAEQQDGQPLGACEPHIQRFGTRNAAVASG